eukprot:1551769-Pyramimonas_sp.AAC.1
MCRLYNRDSPLQHGKQKLPSVLFQTKAKAQLDIQHPTDPNQRLCGPAGVVLCQLFGHTLNKSPETSNPKYFCAAKGGNALAATYKASADHGRANRVRVESIYPEREPIV